MRLLRESGVDYEELDYTVNPIPKAKLAELVRKIGIKPRDLLRTKEAAYRELGLSDPAVTDDQILDAMVAHSELIQRPIVEVGKRAVLARPVERARELLL
ncbi:MAG: ArsC/Spx/MgsR family protein [Vicinamibacteria bacterium]